MTDHDPKWVVLDALHQCYRCERCGATEALKMPAPVDAFVLRGQAFVAEHRYCEPAGTPEGT